jgi:hypothetical protein
MRRSLARALVSITTMGCALLAGVGPAAADDSNMHHRVVETGPEFAAWWSWYGPGTAYTAQVHATNRFSTTSGRSQPSLIASLWVTRYDADWNTVRETHIEVEAREGYDLRFERPLEGATVTASALPATSCEYDADLTPLGCTATAVGLAVSVTGTGEVQKGPAFVVNVKAPGIKLHAWGNGSWRQAAASGTMAGFVLPAGGGYLATGTDGLVLKRDVQG